MGAISWELFLVFIFPFLFRDRDKTDKDKSAREKGDLNSICLFCLFFMKMDSPNAGSYFMGAISCFYFSFYF